MGYDLAWFLFCTKWNHYPIEHLNWYHILNFYYGSSYVCIRIPSSYIIDFTNAPVVREILGFESSVHVKRMVNVQ